MTNKLVYLTLFLSFTFAFAYMRPLNKTRLNLNSGKPFTIVCLGTSLTKTGGWVNILQDSLRKKYGNNIKVINNGFGGKNIKFIYNNLAELGIQPKPDAVLLESAINDCYNGNNKEYTGVPFDSAKMLLQNIIDQLKKNKSEVILMTMNPPLDTFICKRNPAKDRLRYYEYAAMYKQVADDNGLLFIDNTAKWNELTREQFLKYVPDALHPVTEGSINITVPNILKHILN